MIRFPLARPLLLAILSLALLAAPAPAQQGSTIYDVKSKFQRIIVWDSPHGTRQLVFDPKFDGNDSIQSEMKLANPTELILAYAKHMITALPAVARPGRILVVGLGGACIQRYLYKLLPSAVIETAELDPYVLDTARRFFNFREDDRQKVALGDGRKFIEQSKDKYDLIMLDAFSATSIPYPLSTVEFLQAVKEHLAEGGAVCANLWFEENDYNDMVKTYDAVFPEWHVLRCTHSTNVILLALPVKLGLTPEKWMELAKAFDAAHPTGLDLAKLIDQGSVESSSRIPLSAQVLRDADADKHKRE